MILINCCSTSKLRGIFSFKVIKAYSIYVTPIILRQFNKIYSAHKNKNGFLNGRVDYASSVQRKVCSPS